MNVTGIIAEYNPFHKGHAYHLKKARELTHADFVLVIMGGNFTQRGEPAIVDKYDRARMALLEGADLVAELPVAFATGSAEYFAEGAIELLEKCGVVSSLCFGSESGELSALSLAAEILLEEPSCYQTILQEGLKAGKSFPAAREAALLSSLRENAASALPPKLLSSPNNILGIEYIKALKRRKSAIQPVTIPRLGDYHGDFPEGEEGFASASAIRQELLSLDEELVTSGPDALSRHIPALHRALPESSYHILMQGFPAYSFTNPERFALPLHYRLLQAKEPLEFAAYLDVTEELSRRIFSLRNQFCGYDAFLELVKTRHFTRTRIARALLHILLDIKKEEVSLPSSLRVLGFRRDAQPLLTELKKKSAIPLITKVAGHEELSKELAASTLYHLGNPYSEEQNPLVIL